MPSLGGTVGEMKYCNIIIKKLIKFALYVLIGFVFVVGCGAILDTVMAIVDRGSLRKAIRCQEQINQLRDQMRINNLNDQGLTHLSEVVINKELMVDPYSGGKLKIMQNTKDFLILSVGPNGVLDTSSIEQPISYAPTNGLRSSNGDIWASSDEESINIDHYGGYFRL